MCSVIRYFALKIQASKVRGGTQYMPLVYQQNINEDTVLALWEIEEEEAFFNGQIHLVPEIRHPHKRLQHLAGRYLLTHIEEGFPVSLIQIADSRKPFLENGAFHFSISHCGNYAAAIVSKSFRVGIDIEAISPKANKLRDKFLTTNEQILLWDEMKNENLAATCGWSIKEALFKWYALGGVDFKADLDIFSLDYSPASLQYRGEANVRKGRGRILPFEGRVLPGLCLTFTVSRN